MNLLATLSRRRLQGWPLGADQRLGGVDVRRRPTRRCPLAIQQLEDRTLLANNLHVVGTLGPSSSVIEVVQIDPTNGRSHPVLLDHTPAGIALAPNGFAYVLNDLLIGAE